MDIKQFAQNVHNEAVKHGWWENGERNFGELIALCHSELSEALEEYRAGHKPTEKYYECVSGKDMQDKCIGECCAECGGAMPCGIPSELADVVIRIFDLCGYYGIDIEAILEEKADFNAKRFYRHGGKNVEKLGGLL